MFGMQAHSEGMPADSYLLPPLVTGKVYMCVERGEVRGNTVLCLVHR